MSVSARTPRRNIQAAMLQDVQLNQILLAILQAGDKVVEAILIGKDAIGKKRYHLQMVTSGTDVSVVHGTDSFPSVVCIGMDNSVVDGVVEYVDTNQVFVHFNSPFTGVILCKGA